MKKKYLFDKIVLEGNKTKFIPYREATVIESFMASTPYQESFFGEDTWEYIPESFGEDTWEYISESFKEFLKMLSKTKLNENNEYSIFLALGIIPTRREPISFDKALKLFATYMYRDKMPNEKVLAKFYQKAYQIREQAKKDKELLNKEPQVFIK